jgi:hypothetical protein
LSALPRVVFVPLVPVTTAEEGSIPNPATCGTVFRRSCTLADGCLAI